MGSCRQGIALRGDEVGHGLASKRMDGRVDVAGRAMWVAYQELVERMPPSHEPSVRVEPIPHSFWALQCTTSFKIHCRNSVFPQTFEGKLALAIRRFHYSLRYPCHKPHTLNQPLQRLHGSTFKPPVIWPLSPHPIIPTSSKRTPRPPQSTHQPKATQPSPAIPPKEPSS